MPRCAVVVCKYTSSNVNYSKDGISFHTYPKYPKIKEKWINAAGRGPDWFPTKSSTICSSHFESNCFQPLKKVRRLFEWSVPTLKLRAVLTDYSEPSTSKTEINADVNMDHDNKKSPDLLEHSEKNEIIETPRMRKLRRIILAQKNVLKKQKLQIKSLQKKTSHYRKKITNLNDILANLKEKNLSATIM